jgi:hypothetical protein
MRLTLYNHQKGDRMTKTDFLNSPLRLITGQTARQTALTLACLGLLIPATAATPAFAEGTTYERSSNERVEKRQERKEKKQERKQERREKMFEETDSNKDGFLTREEMRAAHEKRQDKMFENLDSDKDGRLSKEELAKGRDDMKKKFKDNWKDRNDKTQ